MLEREERGMWMIVTREKEKKVGHSPSEKGEPGGRD
jgi:hypothetical protein